MMKHIMQVHKGEAMSLPEGWYRRDRGDVSL